MTAVPPEAVTAAQSADRELAHSPHGPRLWTALPDDRVRRMLEAAAPLIAAAERDRITAELAKYRFHDQCTRGEDCPEVYHCGMAFIGEAP